MQERGGTLAGNAWQIVSMLLCVALVIAMIINTQMSGEAMWFWYGTVFARGAKLYSDLHTALQPLFVLETSTWLRLFGPRLVMYELPSLVHGCLLIVGISLILRESRWPDWQKAIVLLGAFVYVVCGHSYRFDDYHILAEAFITYALWLLLVIGRLAVRVERRARPRRLYGVVAALGLVCGLTLVTRVTDGAALVTASVISVPVLLRTRPGRERVAALGVLLAVALLTVLGVVGLTGDTFPAYLANSLFHAAGSKGGTGSIFAAPLRVIRNTVGLARRQKRIPLLLAVLAVVGYAIARLRPRWVRWIVPVQVALAGVLLLLFASAKNRMELRRGLLFEDVVLYLTLLMYVALAAVLLHWWRARQEATGQGTGGWDAREILIVLPILEWASYSAGAAAEPLTNYYAPVALLLLLIPVLEPFPAVAVWAYPSVVTLFGLVAINGVASKVIVPYAWQNYHYAPMFQDRAMYQHPVYGTMYVDRDLLRFSQKVCADIGAQPGVTRPALLSLPYPYPNYFCATPPWHDYVQTFFDTSPRATIVKLIGELRGAPPEWIVYQRQMNVMRGAEYWYNHSRPLAQRDLDTFIMEKLRSGQWTLVDYNDYLNPVKPEEAALGAGWYVIRTQPVPSGQAVHIP